MHYGESCINRFLNPRIHSSSRWTHFTQVNEKLQLLLTSGVINSLTQHVRQTDFVPQRPLLLGTTDDDLDPRLNAQLKQFVSWRPDPDSVGADALQLP